MNALSFEKNLYFDIIEDEYLKCKINNCSKKLKDGVKANLKRHIITFHADEAQSIGLIKAGSGSSEIPKKKPKLSLAFQVQNACVGLLSKHALPFRLFDAEEFKFLLNPIFTKCNMTSNSKNAVQMVLNLNASATVRNLIRDELKGRVFALKVDSASRSDRHVLGINCQFVIDGVICVRTLGMIEIFERQTAEVIKTTITDLLSSFGVKRTLYSSLPTMVRI